MNYAAYERTHFRLKRDSVPMVILYVLCIFGAGMGDWKPLNTSLGSIPKIISLGTVGIAFLYLLVTGDFHDLSPIIHYLIMSAAMVAGIFVLSLGIWIVDLEDLQPCIKGCGKILFQFISMAIVFSAVYIFRSRAIRYTFWGLAGANICIIAIESLKSGIGTAIAELTRSILSFGNADTVLVTAVEVHDITFVMGMFLLYFLFFERSISKKERYISIAVSLLLFLIGLKRIAVIGIVLDIAVILFVRHIRTEKSRRSFLTLLMLLLVVVSFVYVYFVKSGMFEYVSNALGINTMGRINIYNFVKNEYEFSLTYGGKGFEYITSLLNAQFLSDNVQLAARALHNDILKMYIELGFWGFLLWSLYYYYYQTHWLMTRFYADVGVLFASLILYMFATYMTDNTLFYYWSSTMIRMMPLAYSFGGETELMRKQAFIEPWR